MRRRNLAPDALLGRQGEEAAYWHLRNQGFLMVERNYRPEGLHGEIDLIGWEGNILVFVEVKTRWKSGVLMPEAAVDGEKERNLVAAAREYRRRANRFSSPFRFDIVTIVVNPAASSEEMEIRHFRDAFRESHRISENG